MILTSLQKRYNMESKHGTIVERKRHIAKAISWRILGTLDTVIISWIFTNSLAIGAAIGGFEVITTKVAQEQVANYVNENNKEREEVSEKFVPDLSVDSILDRITEVGINNITKQEKEFLDKNS